MGFILSKRNGMSLLEVLLAMAILAVIMTSTSDLMVNMTKMNKMAAQHIDEVDLKMMMNITLLNKSVDMCASQVNPTNPGNSSNPNLSNLYFDASHPGGTISIDLRAFRLAPTYSPGAIYIQSAVAPVEPSAPGLSTTAHGLRILKIAIKNLIPASGGSNRWQGQWTVELENPDGTPVAPIQISQDFYINAQSLKNDPTHAFIDGCVTHGVVGFVASCPSGYTMIGQSSQIGTFCIDSSARSATNYWSAKSTCAAQSPAGFGPAHLCDQSESYIACSTGGGPSGQEVFIDEFDSDGAVTAGRNSCDWTGYMDFTSSEPFRCCLD